MLPAVAVIFRTGGARQGASRTISRVSAPAQTLIRCPNHTLSIWCNSRALSTTHALDSASSSTSNRTREIVAQTISNIGSKRETAAYLRVFTVIRCR